MYNHLEMVHSCIKSDLFKTQARSDLRFPESNAVQAFLKSLWLLGALTCSRSEDGLSCWHGVKPPLNHSILKVINCCCILSLYTKQMVFLVVFEKRASSTHSNGTVCYIRVFVFSRCRGKICVTCLERSCTVGTSQMTGIVNCARPTWRNICTPTW